MKTKHLLTSAIILSSFVANAYFIPGTRVWQPTVHTASHGGGSTDIKDSIALLIAIHLAYVFVLIVKSIIWLIKRPRETFREYVIPFYYGGFSDILAILIIVIDALVALGLFAYFIRTLL